jgi:hypothetical protein
MNEICLSWILNHTVPCGTTSKNNFDHLIVKFAKYIICSPIPILFIACVMEVVPGLEVTG